MAKSFVKIEPLKRIDFNYLREKPFRERSSLFLLFHKPSRLHYSYSRFAFSLSKKVGKAVVRNRLRRILKEFLRTQEDKTLGVDFLIVVNNLIFKKFPNSSETEQLLLGELKDLLVSMQAKYVD